MPPRRSTAAARSGSIALATCFSLYATKNVAAGEGGMVTTDDDGTGRGAPRAAPHAPGDGSLYDVRTAGFKANLSDVLAAIALCQLDKIDAHAEIRRRHVEVYDAVVDELPGISPLARDPRDRHALHLYVVRIDPADAGADRDAYQQALAEENIGTSIHFLPVHRLTYYRERYPGPVAAPGRGEGRERGALAAPVAGAHGPGHRGRGGCAATCPRPLRLLMP